jgi:serine/threonine protein phosphatase PrpC
LVLTQYRFKYVTRTDKGLVRTNNEDAFGTLPDDGMVVVADGMGGYQGGEVASRLAVDTVLRHLLKSSNGQPDLEQCLDEMEQAVERANLAIWRAADHAPELKGMGTTIVVGVFREGNLAFAWVGDSRLYLVRDGQLVQLTDDHTLVQELVRQGMFDSAAEAIEAGVGDNLLTRAVGVEEPVPIATGSMEVTPDDLYLFCTDGLTHMVADGNIERVLADMDLDLGAKADRMVQLACDAGGMDNVTVVLVKVAVT